MHSKVNQKMVGDSVVNKSVSSHTYTESVKDKVQ
jgi:hypothetical protein